MEFIVISTNFIYAILGVVLMYMAYKMFDFLTPRLNYDDELKKGNTAVAIFVASIFIGIAMIISKSLN